MLPALAHRAGLGTARRFQPLRRVARAPEPQPPQPERPQPYRFERDDHQSAEEAFYKNPTLKYVKWLAALLCVNVSAAVYYMWGTQPEPDLTAVKRRERMSAVARQGIRLQEKEAQRHATQPPARFAIVQQPDTTEQLSRDEVDGRINVLDAVVAASSGTAATPGGAAGQTR